MDKSEPETPKTEPEEAQPSPEERSARSLDKIKDAVYIFLFVTIIGQCTSSFQGKSKEAEAMSDVAYELRQLREDLKTLGGSDGIADDLRAIGGNLAQIKETIQYKSCD